MTEADAFLRAIVERPDDIPARLAYADWLEEQEIQDRCDYIRLCYHHKTMTDEEISLHAVNGQEWILPLARAFGCSEEPGFHKGNRFRFIGSLSAQTGSGGRVDFAWRRGFVERVACTLDDWLKFGTAAVLCQPIREVGIRDREPFQATKDSFLWVGVAYPPMLFGRTTETAVLPQSILDQWSEDGAGTGCGIGTVRGYNARRRPEAFAVLSSACVRSARQQAGLPPLA